MADQQLYPLADALAHAQTLADYLRSLCERIEIAGSIRRKREQVHDIDLVAIPKPKEEFSLQSEDYEFQEFFDLFRIKPLKAGKKIISFNWPFKAAFLPFIRPESLGESNEFGMLSPAIPVDLYIADAESWPSILLIRTGSAEHNKMLCKRARSMGMMLHANGEGLARQVVGDLFKTVEGVTTEADIFRLLNMDYVQPERREA